MVTKQHVDFDNLPINHETMVHVSLEGSETQRGALQLLDYLYNQKLLDCMRVTLHPPFTTCRCENNGSVGVPEFLRIDFVSATRVPGAERQTLKALWTALIGNDLKVTWKHGDTGFRIGGPDCEIIKTWELCDDMT